MSKKEPIRFSLDCIQLDNNPEALIDTGGFKVELVHREGEPGNANRIRVKRNNLEIEILPSKGFSIGETILNGEKVLWDAPIGLPDPDELDLLSDEISIFGNPTPCFTYIKTFVGGIEFLGMTNWGMPGKDELTGELLPLHGEVSNIPVNIVDFEINDKGLLATGTIIYRTLKGDTNKVWYNRGQEMYRITKSLFIDRNSDRFEVRDSILNVSGGPLVPDWGYHVTFWPEPGSRLLVPSLNVEERSGGPVPENIDTWKPAEEEAIRTEIGIIHKELKPFDLDGTPSTRLLKLYPDGRAFRLTVPLSPYFQTWYSSGGNDYDEFTYNDGTPVFSKSWNGFGIEIGSSPLDHNGNIDPTVEYKDTLAPGESMEIRIGIELIGDRGSAELMKEINAYNSGRNEH